MSEPLGHRDPAEVARKLDLLHQPHIAPLTAFVERLRESRGGGESVPYFDSTEAGIEASILLLLEAPGRRAVGPGGPRPAAKGSGFISPDNNDQTAKNMWLLLKEAGLDRRRHVVTWNVVPWYVGDGTRIRGVTGADLDEARPALVELLSLLPAIRVAVLLGRAAERGWSRLGLELETIAAPHPSPLVINRRPGARAAILDALVHARLRATMVN